MEELAKLLETLEEQGTVADYYFHRNYQTGGIELNIEFSRQFSDNYKKNEKIRESESCAFWE